MDAKDAVNLHKSRDASEKLFQADKLHLGNSVFRIALEEAASSEKVTGFLALVIRVNYKVLTNKSKRTAEKTEDDLS